MFSFDYDRSVKLGSRMKTLPWFLAVFSIAESCFPSYKPGPVKCSCGVPFNKQRVIGGRPALTQEFPWQVALFADSLSPFPLCGGSLLSSTTVLTAAHCITTGMKSITVAFPDGEVSLLNATKIVTSRIEVHPNWNINTLDNDFAVLTLSSPISFSESTMPICLPDPNESYAGIIATATGWGLTEKYIPGSTILKMSPILMAVNITTMSNEQCKASQQLNKLAKNIITGLITPNMICANDEGKTVCNGDSGGPFITLSKDGSYYSQIGVMSWGLNCESISVYSRVTQQIYWIMRTITGETCLPPVIKEEL